MKKVIRDKLICIDVPMYNFIVVVSTIKDSKVLEERLGEIDLILPQYRKMFNPDAWGSVDTLIVTGNDNKKEKAYVLVQINKFIPQIIAHEASHVCFVIMRRIGMKLISESEEAYSYMIGYLVEQMEARLKA